MFELDYVEKILFSKKIKVRNEDKEIKFYTYPKYTMRNQTQSYELYKKNFSNAPYRLKDNGYTTWLEFFEIDEYCLFFKFNDYELAFDADLNVYIVNNFLHKGGVEIEIIHPSYIYQKGKYNFIHFGDSLWDTLYGMTDPGLSDILKYIFIHIFDFFPIKNINFLTYAIYLIRKSSHKAINLSNNFNTFKLDFSGVDGNILIRNLSLVEYNDCIYVVNALGIFYKVTYLPLSELAVLTSSNLDYEIEEELKNRIKNNLNKKYTKATFECYDIDGKLYTFDDYEFDCCLSDITEDYTILNYCLEKRGYVITKRFRIKNESGKVIFKSQSF